MKTYRAKLVSNSPIQFSRYHNTPKLDKESNDDYEVRTWINKAHFDDKGNVLIPAIFFKNALAEVAKYLSIQIPGKGKNTYTKHFEAGLMILEPLITGKTKEDIEMFSVFGSSQGMRGKGARVLKFFPTLREWSGTFDIMVLDETITKDVLSEHIINCGKFQGFGTWRPRNGGTYGRFELKELKSI